MLSTSRVSLGFFFSHPHSVLLFFCPCPAGAGSLPCPQLAVCEMGLRHSWYPLCLGRVPSWGCKERPASLYEGLPGLSGALPVRGSVLPAGLRNCGVLSVKVPGGTRHQLSTAGGED